MAGELKPGVQRKMEERWELQHEAVELLGQIVAEWNSDLESVKCFDLRTVERAKEVVARHKKLSKELGSF